VFRHATATFYALATIPLYFGFPTGFFSSLDGLRCLSILAVLWHHTGFSIEGLNVTQRGHLGVDLFLQSAVVAYFPALLHRHLAVRACGLGIRTHAMQRYMQKIDDTRP
jgi:hypothetical protein